MHTLDGCKVIIYGTGGNGIRLYTLLKDHCRVDFFIDKRAKDIGRLNDVPVINIDDTISINDKDSYVVFITIKNVFEHTNIANDILKYGFNHIIYKPINALRNIPTNNDKKIDDIYEMLVEKNEYVNGYSVPIIEKIEYKFRNRLFIDENNEEIRAWCPIELLFNYKDSNDYPGINMPLFFPLVELYRCFLGHKDINIDEAIENFIIYGCEWLKAKGKTLDDAQRRSFVESRALVFQEMQKMTEVDNDFFKRNCPKVHYENGKFYLVSSGRNRVSFLIAKGYKYIPVRMVKSDYERWCDLEGVLQFEKKINSASVKSFFAPYPNPYLVDFNIDFVDYQRLLLIPLANSVIKEIYLKCRYFDGSLTCTDFEQVESEKKQYRIVCDIDDGGVSDRYFNSIGIGSHNFDAKYSYKVLLIENYDDSVNMISNGFWIKDKYFYAKILKETNK